MSNLRHPPPSPVTRWAVHDATGDEVELEPTRTWFEARSAACREFTAKFGRTVDPSEVTIHEQSVEETQRERMREFWDKFTRLCARYGFDPPKNFRIHESPETVAIACDVEWKP